MTAALLACDGGMVGSGKISDVSWWRPMIYTDEYLRNADN